MEHFSEKIHEKGDLETSLKQEHVLLDSVGVPVMEKKLPGGAGCESYTVIMG